MDDTILLKGLFNERISRFTLLAKGLKAKSNKISWLRLLAVLSIIGCLVFCYYKIQIFYFLSAALILSTGFIYLIIYHKKLKLDIEQKEFLIFINENELHCLDGNTKNNYSGAPFINPKHKYTGDLDIFGPSSLYQYLCRAWTKGGRAVLASWLDQPAFKDEILKRQAAVQELMPLLDWRQIVEVQAMGLKIININEQKLKKEEGLDEIGKWLASPKFFKNANLIYLVYGMQVLSLLIIIAVIYGYPGKLFFIPIIINAIISSRYKKNIHEIRENTSKHTRFLKPFGNILECIEKQEFSAEKLKAIKYKVSNGTSIASNELKKLSSVLYNMQTTENPYFYPIANYLFLWDLFWVQKLENWKNRNARLVEKWFEGIYEMEALNSFASASFLNTDWVYPTISIEKFILKGTVIAHPLINKNKRIPNDMTINGIGQSIVITGSNMSGKSTFLRTLGINTVMALAGLPVCAKAFEVSYMQLYTSMRTQDSLEENTSSFYAELKRLKGLLESLSDGTPIFYLLDEILKGTNSLDRHKGAKAIIEQMNESNASGLISTHDLELGAVATKDPEHVSNYSFNSDLENGKLIFDYKIRPGVCNSFNASELMRQIGIKIKEEAN